MALIVESPLIASGQQDLTFQTLTDGDTLTLVEGRVNILILSNNTGGLISGSFIGDAAPATHPCQGFGELTTTPQAFSIADGTSVMFQLNMTQPLLAGTVDFTAGITGLEAALIAL